MSGGGDPIKRHAKQLFERLVNPWPENDRWSIHTRATIRTFVRDFVASCAALGPNTRTLNVGSHGNSYGVDIGDHVHVDIAESSLGAVRLACVADAEALPFPDSTFELTLCVGSVVNYCSAARAIGELSRVLKPGGYLLLEFETSESPEFAGTEDFGKDVAVVHTFYNGSSERIYVYSRAYVEGSLAARGINVIKSKRFHLLSPLVYRVTRHERFASLFGVLDRVVSRITGPPRTSANLFIAAQKHAQ